MFCHCVWKVKQEIFIYAVFTCILKTFHFIYSQIFKLPIILNRENQINLSTQYWNSFFLNYQLNAQFLYSSTICMLHYDPQHVSSSTLLILKRTNCITTASGIVTLEIGAYNRPHFINIWSFTYFQGDDTRGCGDIICPPEDKQRAPRNMLRIVV